jgi:hypothetical protein
MSWSDKNGVAQNSKVVLSISNWHFNRSTLKDPVGPTCNLENIMVTLKLSSTIFETSNQPGATNNLSGDDGSSAEKDEIGSTDGRAVISNDGETFFFDKNGCIIPLVAFLFLIEHKEFEIYLRAVKDKYNYKEKNLAATAGYESGRNDDDDDDDGDAAEIVSSKKGINRKRSHQSLYGRNKKKAIVYVGDTIDNDNNNESDHYETMMGSQRPEELDAILDENVVPDLDITTIGTGGGGGGPAGKEQRKRNQKK